MKKGERKIIIAIGGASGAIYAKLLLDKILDLQDQWNRIGVVLSDNAKINWELEIGPWEYNYPFDFYGNRDYHAPFASGSAQFDTMIICPCSMGLLGRIAHGLSTDLISRAADVVLKERRRLILVARETPLSLIHLKNMTAISEAGGIICPAIPSFYSKPQTVEEVVNTVVHRVLDLAKFDINSHRWGT